MEETKEKGNGGNHPRRPPGLTLVVGAEATISEIARQKNSQHVREVGADEELEVLFIGQTQAITCEGDGHEHEWHKVGTRREMKVPCQPAEYSFRVLMVEPRRQRGDPRDPDGDQVGKVGGLGHRDITSTVDSAADADLERVGARSTSTKEENSRPSLQNEPRISNVVLRQIISQASKHSGSELRGRFVMAAFPTPRLFAAFRVEAFFLFGILLWWRFYIVQYIYADACTFTTKCLVVRKSLKPSAVVHTTFCLVTSIPLFGLANVNPY